MTPPNDKFTFMHLGVAVPELSRAMQDYQQLFGYQLLAGPFDDPIQRVSVCFIGKPNSADPSVELIAPLGEDSPVTRLLQKGGGAYHLCFGVRNIEQRLAELRAEKCIVISNPVPAVAFGGRRIAWFYTPSRQLVEIVETA